jgi:quinol-cytochrome oxidoreductase complex cytochrome b subunit
MIIQNVKKNSLKIVEYIKKQRFKGVDRMNTYKLYFIANVIIILILSITIYLHQGSLGWLLIMIMAMVLEVITIINKEKKGKNENRADKE